MSKQIQKTSKKPQPEPPKKPAQKPVQKPPQKPKPQEPIQPKPKKEPKCEIISLAAIKEFDQAFDIHAKNLSRHYSRFLSLRNDWGQPLTAEKLFLQWLKYYHNKTEDDLFKGNSRFQTISNPENIYKASDEKILFQNFNFLKVIGTQWPIRFESNFFFFLFFYFLKIVILIYFLKNRQIHTKID